MEESLSKNNTVVDHVSLSEALDSVEAQYSRNAQNVTNINLSATPIEIESLDQVGMTSLPVSWIQFLIYFEGFPYKFDYDYDSLIQVLVSVYLNKCRSRGKLFGF